MREWIERHRRTIVWALLAGFLLRCVFVWKHPRFDGDTLVYGDLARNMLQHHVYGLTEGRIRPTLIRLPGYPLFLAACFALFGVGRYLPVLWIQVLVGLGTCLLVADLTRRLWGERAAGWALWIACLCPFTAIFDATALTESWSLFCVALAFWALQRWIEEKRMRWVLTVGIALAWAVLLRPEQGLLAAAVVPAMFWHGWRARGVAGVKPALLASLLVALALTLWGVRNWRVFHVVQPLAPKYANDPGEFVSYGFYRWYRTWGIDYANTVKVYWEYDGDTLDVRDLPRWAFDTVAQRAETAEVIAEYNQASAASPEFDAMWQRLATDRIEGHRLRSFVIVPTARLLDMWLRPRTEFFALPLDFWRVRAHPWQSLVCLLYAALCWVLLAVALVGILCARWWRTTAGGAMVAFVVLRCALLLTIDNSEPRYTLECFPIIFCLAAAAVTVRARESNRASASA